MRCILIFFISLTLAAAAQPDARAIMTKVENRDTGNKMKADLEMVLIDKRSHKRTRKIRSYSMEQSRDTYTIMFFLKPPDVAGTAFLTYDYDDPKQDDDQWLYMPALRKVKRIAAGEKSSSFMGSDFNYSDMTAKDTADYDYQLLKETRVRDHAVWVIKGTPRRQETAAETGYQKSIVFVRQDNYVLVRAVLWVYDSTKRKFLDVKKLQKINGIWTALETHMTTKQGSVFIHKTIMKKSNVKYGADINRSWFTVQKLKQGL
ncbi:MAG TPA: outer membrane lipoprotein-sorting protein [Spirochaetota bacterium]|nr:outer membrane lipoprotein-sorting protein [Spirochaetota bacterium]